MASKIGNVVPNVVLAKNSLGHARKAPLPKAKSRYSALKDGDFAGICAAMQAIGGFVGATREEGKNYIVAVRRPKPPAK